MPQDRGPLRLEKLPLPEPGPRKQLVIKDAAHAHTASMRLRNAANLLERENDPELTPEEKRKAVAGLRAEAEHIEAMRW